MNKTKKLLQHNIGIWCINTPSNPTQTAYLVAPSQGAWCPLQVRVMVAFAESLKQEKNRYHKIYLHIITFFFPFTFTLN